MKLKNTFLIAVMITAVLLISMCNDNKDNDLRIQAGELATYMTNAAEWYRNGDFSAAYDYYLEAYKMGQKDGTTLYYLARSAWKGKKQYTTAMKYYKEAEKTISAAATLSDDYMPLLAATYFDVAYINYLHENQKKYEQYRTLAYSLLQDVIDLNLDDPATYFRLAYLKWLDILEASRINNSPLPHDDCIDIINMYRKAIILFELYDPGHEYHATAYHNIGVIYYELHDYQNANPFFAKAVEFDPDNITYTTALRNNKSHI